MVYFGHGFLPFLGLASLVGLAFLVLCGASCGFFLFLFSLVCCVFSALCGVFRLGPWWGAARFVLWPVRRGLCWCAGVVCAVGWAFCWRGVRSLSACRGLFVFLGCGRRSRSPWPFALFVCGCLVWLWSLVLWSWLCRFCCCALARLGFLVVSSAASSVLWSAFRFGSLAAVRLSAVGGSASPRLFLRCGFGSAGSARRFAARWGAVAPFSAARPAGLPPLWVVCVPVSGLPVGWSGGSGPGFWVRGGVRGCAGVAASFAGLVVV